MIKAVIIEPIRNVYMTGFDTSGFTCDEGRYERDVKRRDPNLFRASLLWLVEGQVTSE
jgi:hypothetical protein